MTGGQRAAIKHAALGVTIRPPNRRTVEVREAEREGIVTGRAERTLSVHAAKDSTLQRLAVFDSFMVSG